MVRFDPKTGQSVSSCPSSSFQKDEWESGKLDSQGQVFGSCACGVDLTPAVQKYSISTEG